MQPYEFEQCMTLIPFCADDLWSHELLELESAFGCAKFDSA